MPEFEPLFRQALSSLLGELIDGPPEGACYVLNPGDRGILGSLDALSAEQASARPNGRSSVASHVDHVAFGFDLLNRWWRGENPFADSDFGASWKRQQVTDDEWRALRSRLATDARAWRAALERPHEWDAVALGGAIGSAAHLAYHLGAIRQLVQAASGPRAEG